jgi:hypothetical protein
MDFLEKFNTDNVFLRGVILGLLSKLNEKITYDQIEKDQSVTQIFIPFFYSLAGDEPFLQDFYLSYEDCDGKPAFSEGNYDVVPRGILEMGSIRIDSSSSTSKFVRGSYVKEIAKENGSEMVTYSSYINPIPLSIDISAKIRVDTVNEAFKVQQSTIETLYKRFIYHFEYKGIRIPVQVSIPDSFPDKQPNNFSFGYGTTSGEGITLSFSMSLETYLPQLDLTTERFRGNLMQGGIKIKVDFGTVPNDNSSIITGLNTPDIDSTIK